MIINTIFNPSNILITNNSYREGIVKNSENIYLFNKKQQTNIVSLSATIESEGFNPPIFVNQKYNELYYDPTFSTASFKKYTLKLNRAVLMDFSIRFDLLAPISTYPGEINIKTVIVDEKYLNNENIAVRNYFFENITNNNIQNYNDDSSLNSIYPSYDYIPMDIFHTFSIYLIDNFTLAQKTWLQNNFRISRTGFIRQF